MTETAPRLTLVEDDPDDGGLFEVVRRRLDGTYDLDQWGLDEDLTGLAAWFAGMRWAADVEGMTKLPADGPALLVANRRLGWSEPIVLASVLRRSTGAAVRPVGGVQANPLGGLLRRLGAIPGRPAEVAAALRAGNRVLVPTRAEPVRNRAGHLPVEFLEPAVALGVPLVPVAVIGWEFRRRWTIRIGGPVRVESPETSGADVARQVGTAAVEVAAALDALLADALDFGIIHRVFASLAGSRRGDDVPQWEVD